MKLNTPEYISSIKPYEPGRPIEAIEREYGIKNSVKLASNENPLGPSPKAVAAVKSHLAGMNRYPDGSGHVLTGMLARKYGVNPDNVVIGNGSDDIIALLAQGFLGLGDEALMPLPSFLMYEISVKVSGGVPVMVPLKGLDIDLDAILKAVTPRTTMIFLTNPNNPTGSHITKDVLTAFMKEVPENVLVIMDEAYIEFARDKAIYDSLASPLQDPRIVSLRTFSKAYGLAGFRVGYGIMDAGVAGILHRVRQPFNVNSLAQVAAAAALEDHEFLNQSVQTMHQGIDFLQEQLSAMGIQSFPTQGNFFLLDVRMDAGVVFQKMLEQGVIVRSMKSYGFETYLRISAGLEEENRRFLFVLEQLLSQAGGMT
ncbi:histidinol phosphate aminotransferase apoenzyme [Desulfocicer vacuolatum DSM 3385]|uniref:Histidinol-phosphate aminotransferase n=1 Tax=Desulfocicer vacuolatum DSM 3385 TaxID=1121400 RepID=A0A1W2E4R0_9BACT|nr:histidinol-phosphate transaminase [Desulfocicer vacuolatum]SMD04028.1 histidinol phosphate aminotransferase apoenzyme [Desulfocicer vacuolatum DSM 3385]